MDKRIKVLNGLNKIMIAFLKEDLNFSSRKTKRLLKDGLVLINNKKAFGDSKIKGGDIVYILEEEKQKDYIVPQKMELSILYEDEFLLAIEKPPFISMLPGKTNIDTLANGIRFYFNESNIKEPVRYYNRLDMNTSGIVLIPKSGHIHSLLDRYGSANVEKRYLAIVLGIPLPNSGIVNRSISAVADGKGKRTIADKGRHSITKYTLVERFKNTSLLDIHIETGRTHQIRIHLSSIGHPIIGDELYGVKTKFIKRQALHAYKLKFFHPIKEQSLIIESPIPEDIKKLINILRKEDVFNLK